MKVNLLVYTESTGYATYILVKVKPPIYPPGGLKVQCPIRLKLIHISKVLDQGINSVFRLDFNTKTGIIQSFGRKEKDSP